MDSTTNPLRHPGVRFLKPKKNYYLLVLFLLFSISVHSSFAQLTPLTISVQGVKLSKANTDGSRAIMIGDNGKVYIFEYTGFSWYNAATLSGFPNTASDGLENVAISGNTAVITTYHENQGNYTGKAYVYTYNGSGWAKTATLKPADAVQDDRFGSLISIEGNRIVIGAPGDSKTSTGKIIGIGAIYIYDKMGSTWAETKIIGSNSGSYSYFGFSLDLSGNRIIVGEGFSDKVYVYTYQGNQWNEKIIPPVSGSDEYAFGTSVSISGDYAVIGDPENGILEGPGTAYIYKYNGNNWNLVKKLFPTEDFDDFGDRVFIDGKKVLVNANNDDNVGRSYLYAMQGTNWVLQETIENQPQNPNFSTDASAFSGNIILAGTIAGGSKVYSYILPQFEQQNLSPVGSVDENMGISVAISGDITITGAIGAFSQGFAYTYEKEGAKWLNEAIISGSDTQAGDRFGISVDVDNNFAIIGAHQNDDAGSSSGSAYIMELNGDEFHERAKLVASDAKALSRFGYSVGISGKYALVSAPYDDPNGKSNAGSAYVFRYNGSNWVQIQKIVAPDAKAGDYFGWSVAISGGWMVIGSYRDDDFKSDAGSAYLYQRENTNWVFRQKVNASDPGSGDRFGTSVAISGQQLIVGAPLHDGPGSNSGSAYVFRNQSGNWVQQSKLVASDVAADDRFGYSVSVSGDKAVVGSPYDDNANGTNAGAMYVYEYTGGNWVENRKITASTGHTGDKFGNSVAIDGTSAVAGAYGNDENTNENAGAIYIYDLSGLPAAKYNTPTTSNKLIAIEPSAEKTKIEDLQSKLVTVYPNPVDEQIHVMFDNLVTEKVKISVVDASGRLISAVQEVETNSKDGRQLDISAREMHSGIYYLKIESARSVPKLVRIIKK